MASGATADLLAEVQALIREREREGVLGLAERVGPADWAHLVPQLESSEVAVSPVRLRRTITARRYARVRPKPHTMERSSRVGLHVSLR